jgi:hypothetical protein
MEGRAAHSDTGVSLRTLLARPPWRRDGLLVISYPKDLVDIRGELARSLVERDVTAPLPFESLHRRVRPEDKLPVQGLAGAPTIQTDTRLRSVYHTFIKYLAREILQFDVVFEANPPLRFHFPMRMPDRFRSAEGILLTHHSDLLGGDPFDQINGWLPLTDCRATSALQVVPFAQSQQILFSFATRLDFDAAMFAKGRTLFYEALCEDQELQDEMLRNSRPLDIDYGEVALFDSRLIHATAENIEDITRISIDFRLLPMDAYEVLARRWAEEDRLPSARWKDPLKGGFYDERSAYEL